MPAKSKEEVVQEFRIQSIQDAAMRVIARKGMAAATMQDIAEEAGVAKGTIYLYFRDRDELVEKTFETAINQLHGLIDEAWLTGESFDEKLRAILAAKFAFFRENREFFRLYASLRLPEGRPAGTACQAQYRARIDIMAQSLGEAMERGEIRRMSPRRLAIFIIEGSNALVIERVMEDSSPPEQEDVDLITSVIIDGISMRKSTKRSTH
ncbi:MAG TPA: TetR/AcrR family transcriptional regulator [Thermoanaerobaculia bacterium]|nr:TetR/AcrR family transcriptional regulator [Thermoanaerobaculia bacterium]